MVVANPFCVDRAALKLSKEFPEYEIVLIDSKDYFENTIAVLTCLTHVEITSSVAAAMKIVMRHDHYLTGRNIRILKEFVKEVTPTKVILSNETIYFDYLLLACGTSYRSSIKAQNLTTEFRVQSLTRDASDLAAADSVVVVGGGLVGVELAAEIIHSYPKKDLTIITSGDRLLERMQPNVSKAAHKWLAHRGVKIIYGERVRQSKKDPSVFRLPTSGTSISPQKAYWCTGFEPNSGLMQKNFASSLNKEGFVKVNKFFQVEGVEAGNIFAIGDLADLPEEKMAERAWAHAKFAVKSLKTLAKGEPLKKAYKSSSTPPLMVVSLGPDYALLCRNRSLTTQGTVAGTFKRYLFRMMMVKQAKALSALAAACNASGSLTSRLSIDRAAFVEKNKNVALIGHNSQVSSELALLLSQLGSTLHLASEHDIDRNAADSLAQKAKNITSHHVDPKIPASALAAFKSCSTVIFTYLLATNDPVELIQPYLEAIKTKAQEGTLKRMIVVHPGYRLERAPKKSLLGSKLRELEETVRNILPEKLIVTIIRFAPTYEYLKATAIAVIEERKVRFPVPERGLPLLAAADVRDSVVRVMEQPEAHDNQTYSLCGDDRLSGEDIAAAISTAVSSKEITIDIAFENVPAAQLTAEFTRVTNIKYAPVYVDWFEHPKHLTKQTDDLSAVLEKSSIAVDEWVQLNEHIFV